MPIFLPEEAEMLTTAWDPNLDTSSHEHTETLNTLRLFMIVPYSHKPFPLPRTTNSRFVCTSLTLA